jgi:hypothetical protein
MESKKWYASKTMWANIGVVVAGVGTIFTGEASMAEALPAIVLGAINIGLRIITGKPITM